MIDLTGLTSGARIYSVTPSRFQRDIFFWTEDPNPSRRVAIIQAVAGSGKTTTILNCAKFIPPNMRTLFVAFAKKNVEDLRAKLPANTEAATLNSIGHRAWLKFAGIFKIEVNGDLNYEYINELIDPGNGQLNHSVVTVLTDRCRDAVGLGVDFERYKRMLSGNFAEEAQDINRLISLAKSSGLVPHQLINATGHDYNVLMEDTKDNWVSLIESYDLAINFQDVAIEVARRVLIKSVVMAGTVIDYDSQLWLPVIHRANFNQYDWLLVDECFTGDTPITIGHDGSSMKIRDMVESKYSGTVLCYNESTGKTEEKTVIGHHRIASGKKMLKVKVRRCGYRSDGSRMHTNTERAKFGDRFIICTEDHRVFSDGRWIEAKSIRPGMPVIVESCHKPVSSYVHGHKFTPSGREKLSSQMSAKNASGVCGTVKVKKGTFAGKRGGNGRGPAPCEQSLLERLGDGWSWNVAIPTKIKRGNGYPTCYKLDLANSDMMIAVEVDGHSHNMPDRKEQDLKKDEFLESLVWSVVRINNHEIPAMSDDLLNARVYNSPCPAEVVSVEEWFNKEPFVYDITVEDNHNFYADGVLVHNCQDLNRVQVEIATQLMKTGGRAIFVGDSYQSIFGFRGALCGSMDFIKGFFDAVEMPLSICYRCPKTIVEHAKEVCPHIESYDGQIEGSLVDIPRYGPSLFTKHDAIICRNTAPLISLLYKLQKVKFPCKILGKDIEHGMVKLINRCKPKDGNLGTLQSRMKEVYDKQLEKDRKSGLYTRSGIIKDRIDSIVVFINELSATQQNVDGLIRKINLTFSMEKLNREKMTILSSCHRAKGGEWPNVYVLESGLMPSKRATSKEAIQQERNCQLISRTRSMKKLGYIYLDGFDENCKVATENPLGVAVGA